MNQVNLEKYNQPKVNTDNKMVTTYGFPKNDSRSEDEIGDTSRILQKTGK